MIKMALKVICFLLFGWIVYFVSKTVVENKGDLNKSRDAIIKKAKKNFKKAKETATKGMEATSQLIENGTKNIKKGINKVKTNIEVKKNLKAHGIEPKVLK